MPPPDDLAQIRIKQGPVATAIRQHCKHDMMLMNWVRKTRPGHPKGDGFSWSTTDAEKYIDEHGPYFNEKNDYAALTDILNLFPLILENDKPAIGIFEIMMAPRLLDQSQTRIMVGWTENQVEGERPFSLSLLSVQVDDKLENVKYRGDHRHIDYDQLLVYMSDRKKAFEQEYRLGS